MKGENKGSRKMKRKKEKVKEEGKDKVTTLACAPTHRPCNFH